MIVQINVTGRRRVDSWLRGWGARIGTEVGKETQYQALLLRQYIVTVLLNGAVLHARSGALASHVYDEFGGSNESGYYGRVYISTGQVPYAAIHEYGGEIKHPGGTAYFISSTMAGEYIAGGPTFVANRNPLAAYLPRTHAHTIPMPERSYMRRGLADRKDAIISGYKDAIRRALVTGAAARR